MYAELTIDQGASFSTVLTLTNDDNSAINLTSRTFVSQIRKSYYSVNPTANISVVVENAANGVVRMSIDAANTANIKPGRYLYDLKMTDEANTTIRIVEGIVTITPQVSR
jgi:uncharacterized protein YfdQ (DUF2303 family)